MSDNLCDWCGHDYGVEITPWEENKHLASCEAWLGAPVAQTRREEGGLIHEYVALPGFPHILVERERPN